MRSAFSTATKFTRICPRNDSVRASIATPAFPDNGEVAAQAHHQRLHHRADVALGRAVAGGLASVIAVSGWFCMPLALSSTAPANR